MRRTNQPAAAKSGTARAGRMRDRGTAPGTWRFVWQDGRECTAEVPYSSAWMVVVHPITAGAPR